MMGTAALSISNSLHAYVAACDRRYGVSRAKAHFSGSLDDDWDGQVHIVRVDQAHGAPGVARKGCMHRIVR